MRNPIDLPPERHQGATGLPGQIAVGSGALWAINGGEDLARIDPRSGAVTNVVGSLRARAVAAGDGSVWALTGDDTTIAEVDPRSARVRRRLPIPAARLDAIAVGAGAVWAVDSYSGTLWRIDPGPKIVTRTIALSEGVNGLTVGAGAVWVVNGLRGTLVRVDPKRNRVAGTVTVGNTPRDAEVGEGAVWVSLAGGPERLPAAEDEAAADPLLPGHEHDVVDPAGRAAAVLGERAEVGVVPDPQWHPGQGAAEQLAERHVLPAEVGGEPDVAVRRLGHLQLVPAQVPAEAADADDQGPN